MLLVWEWVCVLVAVLCTSTDATFREVHEARVSNKATWRGERVRIRQEGNRNEKTREL